MASEQDKERERRKKGGTDERKEGRKWRGREIKVARGRKRGGGGGGWMGVGVVKKEIRDLMSEKSVRNIKEVCESAKRDREEIQ